ncbi:MAG: hypothetical protein RBU37_25395 [Myxococcota bacterium]|jgi:hypothetical protein|nr:hypothetical protein [Myxococcota bacterium]
MQRQQLCLLLCFCFSCSAAPAKAQSTDVEPSPDVVCEARGAAQLAQMVAEGTPYASTDRENPDFAWALEQFPTRAVLALTELPLTATGQGRDEQQARQAAVAACAQLAKDKANALSMPWRFTQDCAVQRCFAADAAPAATSCAQLRQLFCEVCGPSASMCAGDVYAEVDEQICANLLEQAKQMLAEAASNPYARSNFCAE